MPPAIAFEGVSKRYERGHAPSFREDLSHNVRRIFGRAEPPPVVEALRNINFEVEQGASFAIMGANGSGKTTALRLMSRCTYPSSGIVRVAGRVGALIDVGAGLHPDLTGRENIWLYGRILGLRRADIARHFDDIVSFADIGYAIDQPLKEYSSGMMVRVGFSIASYLEPDILLVDEAISVGDAGFQERCLKRMAAITASGATLVFVSHASSMVANLCPQGMLLREGEITDIGSIDEIVARYLNQVSAPVESSPSDAMTIRWWDYSFAPSAGRFLGDLTVRVQVHIPRALRDPLFRLAVGHSGHGPLLACTTAVNDSPIGTVAGDLGLTCEISELPLEPGQYELFLSAVDGNDKSSLLAPQRLGFAAFGHRPTRRGFHRGAATLRPNTPLLKAPYRWSLVQSGATEAPATSAINRAN